MKIEHEMQLLCPPNMTTDEAAQSIIDKLLDQCPDAFLTTGAPTIQQTPEMIIASVRFTSTMFDHAFGMALQTLISEIEEFRDVIVTESALPQTQKEEYVTILFALLDRITNKYQSQNKEE
jgi:hypothetical protein